LVETSFQKRKVLGGGKKRKVVREGGERTVYLWKRSGLEQLTSRIVRENVREESVNTVEKRS